MKPSRLIMSTFFTMIFVQTVGTVDSQNRLPAPRQFVAISVLWGILFLMAGTSAAKIAARLSALIVLTGMVLGPFGKVAIGFLNTVTEKFAVNPDIQIPLPGWFAVPRLAGNDSDGSDTDDTDATYA